MKNYADYFEEENRALADIVKSCDYKKLGYESKKDFDSAVSGAYVSGIPVMDEEDFENSLKNVLDVSNEEYHSIPDDRSLRDIEWSISDSANRSFVEDLCESWYPLTKELETGEVVGTGIAVNFDTEEVDTMLNLGNRLRSIPVEVSFYTYQVVERSYSSEYGWYEDAKSDIAKDVVKSDIDLAHLLDEEYERENEVCFDMSMTAERDEP